MSNNRPFPGVRFLPGGQAQVSLWAPAAQQADLHLQHSGSTLPLQQAGVGYWQLTTGRLQPGDLYKFSTNGGTAYPDPASRAQPEGVHGPSQATDLKAFSWQDEGWQNPQLNNYIIYELHTGTFSAGGDFAGIIDKLPHLLSLGITAIELMPVAQFPGSRNWGYDGVFPYAVQQSYGGAHGLQLLVQACHQAGIAVILDVVYNHLGPEGNYLGMYGPYFTDKYRTPWGNALNFDDAWCDGVRDYFIQNALMWFRDFHIDALRLDAVHAIRDFGARHLLQELRTATDELIASTGKQYHLIAQLDLNDPRYLNPEDKGGYGMDAQWIDEFHHALRVSAGEPATGYYADFNGVTHLAKAYRDAYVYDGQYSPHRHKKFGLPATGLEGNRFVVFAQNHDQVGNRMLGERSSVLHPPDMQRLLAAAVILSPYLPMLSMGEEWSEPNPFLYFVSHTDPELAAAVRKGRAEEFAAFHATGTAPDPMALSTFEQSRLQWQLTTQEPHLTMLRCYRELIRLRKTHPVLCLTDRTNLTTTADAEHNTLLLLRGTAPLQVAVLLNFSATPQRMQLPPVTQPARLLLNTAAEQWGGTTELPAHAEGAVSVPPRAALVYEIAPPL